MNYHDMALVLTDQTINLNDLTNSGGAEYTADTPYAAITEAVDLELTDGDYLYAADSTSLSISGDMTIEAWIKPESLGASYQEIVAKSENGAMSFRFQIDTGAAPCTMTFLASDDGSVTAGHFVASTTDAGQINTGSWVHVAVTFAIATEAIIFYVNGSAVADTNTGSIGASIFDGTQRPAIGCQYAGGTPERFFDGKVTDVRIWNDVRTPTEINDNKAVLLTGDEANLVAWWPFQQVRSSFIPKVIII